MSKTKFTKGPWEVRVGGNFVDIWCAGKSYATESLPSRFKVGESNYRQTDDGSNSREQAIANATLMAASPELYRLLADLVDVCDGNYAELTEECNRVLAAARGEGSKQDGE